MSDLDFFRRFLDLLSRFGQQYRKLRMKIDSGDRISGSSFSRETWQFYTEESTDGRPENDRWPVRSMSWVRGLVWSFSSHRLRWNPMKHFYVSLSLLHKKMMKMENLSSLGRPERVAYSIHFRGLGGTETSTSFSFWGRCGVLGFDTESSSSRGLRRTILERTASGKVMVIQARTLMKTLSE